MKLCKDCRHFNVRGIRHTRDAQCGFRVLTTSAVDGTNVYPFCDYEREATPSYPGRCGPEGKNWEAKNE